MALKKMLCVTRIRYGSCPNGSKDRRKFITVRLVCFALGLAAILVRMASAQYPGHIETKKTAPQSPRAIAVLEWTGQPGMPSASRIIPLAVFDGQTYQPGGFYLARPEPLALEPGTEYILEKAGVPKGLFDVGTAQDMQGYWFGFGIWRPLMSATHKLQRAKIAPPMAQDNDDSRPHFKNRSSLAQNSSSNSSSQAPADPDRPLLRRNSAPETSPGFVPPGPETAIGGADPDRPHLSYSTHNPTDTQPEGANLTGTPPDLQQMVGVSDAIDRAPHSFVYSWASPGDAAKMRIQMEALARKVLAPGPAPATSMSKQSLHAKPHASSSKTQRKAAAAAVPLLLLSNEFFSAYQLTLEGGATIVFSAQASDAAGKARYVTLIAQPDFYGVPHVIFKSVTSEEDLDVQPKMRLVDAVDVQGNNHGELVFELRSRDDRQFVIYEVAAGQVQQIFTTGPLPDANAG